MDGKATTTEVENLKEKLHAVWTAGDFSKIARSFEAGAANYVDRLGLGAGTRVLDVACGDGNTAIPIASKGAVVTGVDLIPYLIETAKERARDANATIRFDVGDAEALPYQDGSFDTVVSMFGAMFAPRPEMVANELTRVCRPGGKIYMANWTAEGFIGEMFKVTGKHVPPPKGMPSPLLWGNEEVVSQRFNGRVELLKFERRDMRFDFPFSPKDTVECFRKFYGPTQKAFDSLDTAGQEALRRDLEDLWAGVNTGGNETVVYSEYLEVTAVRS